MTCPSILPETTPMRRVDALTAYRHELNRFYGDVMSRALELDAMRREAVGRSCFDLVDTVPGGGMVVPTSPPLPVMAVPFVPPARPLCASLRPD